MQQRPGALTKDDPFAMPYVITIEVFKKAGPILHSGLMFNPESAREKKGNGLSQRHRFPEQAPADELGMFAQEFCTANGIALPLPPRRHF